MRATYILFALAFALQAQADYGTEEWVYIKDPPGCIVSQTMDIEVDNQGYVYVTGYCGPDASLRDYFTIKLNNDGQEIWFVTYNGPSYGIDIPYEIEVDADGFVYVTGYSEGLATGEDICTIKYDPLGNVEWIRRFNGPANLEDIGRRIIVTDSGDVIVAGHTVSSGTDRDYIVIKYDASGDIIWTAVYDGPVGGRDYVDDIVTDEYGNIYVTGQSDGIGSYQDYCTIKYNSKGEEIWTTRYDGTGNYFDRPMAGIALDPEDNIFVSGNSYTASHEVNYCTVKYDNDGNELWTAYCDGPGLTDWAYDIAADENGGVCVTGFSWLMGLDFASCTVRYDTAGNETWENRGDLNNSPGIAVDKYGDAYCCGDFYPEADAGVVKYACGTGETKWRVEYDGPEGLLDCLVSITIDTRGDIYGCGICNIPLDRYGLYTYPLRQTSSDILIIKYSGTVSVELLRFSAAPRDESIALEWEISATEDENVEGFNFYRREVKKPENKSVTEAEDPTKAKSDGWTKVNEELITGANPYSYIDDGVEPGFTYEYKLEAVIGSTTETLGTATATIGAGLPTSYALYQSRPNPAGGTATIAFDLPENTKVTLTVFDISGRKVTTVVNETLSIGTHERTVSGLAPGVYVYKLSAGSFNAARKMVIVE
jgi:hypothetical protein